MARQGKGVSATQFTYTIHISIELKVTVYNPQPG